MKTCIVTYSMSGNNEKLGQKVADSIQADHIVLKDEKTRSMGTVVVDMVFNRTPKVIPTADVIENYEQIILMGPVWMGHVASPLRKVMKHIKSKELNYSFVTISGGTLNKNPKLINDLKKRAGENILLLKDWYIADLMDPSEVNMKDSGEYQLTSNDIELLSTDVVASLKDVYDL